MALAVALLPAAWKLPAQGSGVLTVAPPAKLTIKRNTTAELKLTCTLREGYHTNSHTPSDPYLVPLKLTWDSGALEAGQTVYPKPLMEKYDFTPTPLSVFAGTFEISSKFKAPPNAPTGPNQISGKLRYQACTKEMCLPPKTVEVKVPVIIQ